MAKMDYSKVCRSCMKDVEDFDNAEANLLDMFSYCTRLKINESCKLPKVFCKYCTKAIKCSYSFIRKAHWIDNKLKSLMPNADNADTKNNGKDVSEKNVKSYVDDEDDVDNDNYVDDDGLAKDDYSIGEVIFADSKTEFADQKSNFKTKELKTKTGKNKKTTIAKKKPVKRAGKKKTVTKDKANKTPVRKRVRPKKPVKPLEDVIEDEIHDDDGFGDTDYMPNVSDDDKNEVGIDNQFDSNQIDEKDVKMNVSDEDDKTNVKVEELEVEFDSETKPEVKKKLPVRKSTRESKPVLKNDKPEVEYSCKICMKKFIKELWLRSHIPTYHPEIEDIEGNMIINVLKKEKSEHAYINNRGKKVYVCPFCKKEFLKRISYRNHIKYKKADDTKLCKICTHNKEFKTICHLVDHHHEVHERKNKSVCKTCGKMFALRDNFMKHKETHKEIEPVKCDQCDLEFKTLHDLTTHKYTHKVPRKTILCELCGLTCESQTALQIHMYKHNQEKHLQCPRCPFKTAYRNSMTIHMKRHDQIRNKLCPYCPLTFICSETLNRHVRLHTGVRPFRCPYCEEYFISSWKRKNHIISKHDIPFEEVPRMDKMGNAKPDIK